MMLYVTVAIFFDFTLPSEHLVKKNSKNLSCGTRTALVVCIGTLPLLRTDCFFLFLFCILFFSVNLCYKYHLIISAPSFFF